jgi:RNA polymerase sigma-70 factor (ECF subfamily)
MQEVSEGNLDAMTLLFERYHTWIYNFLFQMIRDTAVCEDLTQNVFYKAIRYRGSYKGGKFASWIFSIARNLSADYFENLKKQREVLNLESVVSIAAESCVETNEEVQKLYVVLDKLPIADKELVVMNRLQGMKYREIAVVLDSTEIAVKTKMHRILKKLRTLYFETTTI